MSKFSDQKIVILAEQRVIVDCVRSALRHMGIARSELFSRPKDALARLHSQKTDVLIIDDSLSDENPYEFVAKLRIDQSLVSRLVPVILISDNGRPKTIMRAIKAGIDEVLVKPISERRITDRVTKTIIAPRECISVPSGYVGPDRRRSVKEFMQGNERRAQNNAQILARAKS